MHHDAGADDLHAVAQLAEGEAVREARGKYGDVVAAPRQSAGFTLGVDGQT
jgi:hypothetical protein